MQWSRETSIQEPKTEPRCLGGELQEGKLRAASCKDGHLKRVRVLWHGTAAFCTQSSVFSVFYKRQNSDDVAMVVRTTSNFFFFRFRRMGDKEKLAKHARVALCIIKIAKKA